MGQQKPVRVGMDLDQFLEHSAGSRGAGKFLKGWRKENDGKITTWLHPAAGFVARWSHGIQHVVTRKDRDTDEMVQEVWGGSFVCWEKEFVLKKQMFREDNGEREYPPTICPMCKLVDFIYMAIKRGDLSWTEPLFRFVGDADDGAVVIHAGGFCNLFRDSKKRPFTPKQKKELREAGVALTEAFKENSVARCQYVFCVVDNSHPENGTQITTEAEALGNAMKKAIADRIQGLGREEGNPLVTPVAFLWEYDEDKDFDKKYRVVPMPKIELTSDVQVLMDEDPPDITNYIAPGNVAELRGQLERYCLIDGIPWDDIFGDAEKAEAKAEEAKAKAEAGGGTDESETAEEEEPEPVKAPPARKTLGAAKPKEEPKPEPEAPKAPPARKTLGAKPKEEPKPEAKPEPAKPVAGKLAPKPAAKAKEPDPEPEAEDDVFECDHCGGEMTATDDACPKCGTTYNLDTGAMTARPCTECNTLIELDGEAKVICSCGLVHVTETWKAEPRAKVEPKAEAKAKAGPKRRSLASKPAADAKGAAEGKPPFDGGGEPLPFNGPDDELPWQQNDEPTDE